VEIYIHLLDLTRNSCDRYNYRSLAIKIQPAALRFLHWAYCCIFRCSSSWFIGLINVFEFPLDNFHLQHPGLTHSVRFGVKLIKVHIMVLLRDYTIRDAWFIDITRNERLSGSQNLFNILFFKIRAGPLTPWKVLKLQINFKGPWKVLESAKFVTSAWTCHKMLIVSKMHLIMIFL
jgi:hypothetical protein